MAETVYERDLLKVLGKLLDMRAWAVRVNMDPWALRQGLIVALVMDTAAALQKGVKTEELVAFDEAVRADAQIYVSRLRR